MAGEIHVQIVWRQKKRDNWNYEPAKCQKGPAEDTVQQVGRAGCGGVRFLFRRMEIPKVAQVVKNPRLPVQEMMV